MSDASNLYKQPFSGLIISIENPVEIEFDKKKIFSCPECNKKYSHHRTLRQHVKKYHPGKLMHQNHLLKTKSCKILNAVIMKEILTRSIILISTSRVFLIKTQFLLKQLFAHCVKTQWKRSSISTTGSQYMIFPSPLKKRTSLHTKNSVNKKRKLQRVQKPVS